MTAPALAEVTDPELLAAVAAGDRSALEDLYRRHSPFLLVRLRRRCQDAGLVEEVLQDAFVAVWAGAGRYDGRGPVAAWLWAIARRRLVDALRRSPRPTVPLDGLLVEPEPVPSCEEQVLSDLALGPLGPAVERLPVPLRDVVRLTVLDGLTTREAADALGVPVGTVKTRAMRARARLAADVRDRS